MMILTCEKLSPEDFYLFLGYNIVVAPRVRRDLLSRTVDNDDLLAQLDTPVLVTDGLSRTRGPPTTQAWDTRHLGGLRSFDAELRGFAVSL